jgi:hypothetical protein
MAYIPQGQMNAAITELAGKDFTPNDRPAGDLYAHAPGRICKKCDRRINASEPARRRGESGWVHDVCPPVDD